MTRILSNQQATDLKRRERLAAKNYDEVLRRNLATIEHQAAEIERLKAQVGEFEAQVAPLPDLRRQIESVTKDRDQWRESFLGLDHKHRKLSGIVRLAMKPEEYHLWHQAYENVEDNFPTG